MVDDLTKLRATLAELHAELAGVGAEDPEIQELLAGAVADIQTALKKQPLEAAARQSSIVNRLSRAAKHYEVSHPTLSGILGSIIDTLSRIGI